MAAIKLHDLLCVAKRLCAAGAGWARDRAVKDQSRQAVTVPAGWLKARLGVGSPQEQHMT